MTSRDLVLGLAFWGAPAAIQIGGTFLAGLRRLTITTLVLLPALIIFHGAMLGDMHSPAEPMIALLHLAWVLLVGLTVALVVVACRVAGKAFRKASGA
jgi:hypothetical protein